MNAKAIAHLQRASSILDSTKNRHKEQKKSVAEIPKAMKIMNRSFGTPTNLITNEEAMLKNMKLTAVLQGGLTIVVRFKDLPLMKFKYKNKNGYEEVLQGFEDVDESEQKRLSNKQRLMLKLGLT